MAQRRLSRVIGRITPKQLTLHILQCPKCGANATGGVRQFKSVPPAGKLQCSSCGLDYVVEWPWKDPGPERRGDTKNLYVSSDTVVYPSLEAYTGRKKS